MLRGVNNGDVEHTCLTVTVVLYHAGGKQSNNKDIRSKTGDLDFHRFISQMHSTTSNERGMLHALYIMRYFSIVDKMIQIQL